MKLKGEDGFLASLEPCDEFVEAARVGGEGEGAVFKAEWQDKLYWIMHDKVDAPSAGDEAPAE